MTSKFSFIMVCASVVLTCLAILPLPVSAGMMCDRQAARDRAEFECINGAEIIFSTIKVELKKRSKNVCEKVSEHDSSNIETGRAGTYAVWAALYDVIFGQIPKNHPLVSPEIRKGAYTMLDKAVNAIYEGITVTTSNTSSEILSELNTLQKTTTCSLREAATKVYAYVRGLKNDPETDAAIDRHRDNTICAAVSGVRNMFDGMRVLLVAISSEIESGSEDDLCSVTNLGKKTNIDAAVWVKNVFDTVDVLYPVHRKTEI